MKPSMLGRNISIRFYLIHLKNYIITLDSRRRFALFLNFILVFILYSLQDSRNPADSLSRGSSFLHIKILMTDFTENRLMIVSFLTKDGM